MKKGIMLSFFIFHLSLFTIHFSLFTLAKPVDYSLQLVKSVTRSRETFDFGTTKTSLSVDSKGFLENGVPVIPVMGEIHFSRVPESDWKREILKMKAGGINYISTYVFWNHHESDEGKWDWTGNRNLRRFVETCKECHLPLVIRIGPFCHGEVYQGGVPSWIVDKGVKTRSMDTQWIEATRKLYEQIANQTRGLYHKDGGPIVGVQLENECRGPWAYYAKLKEMALACGFDVPFFTRTGWPKLNGKEVFGEMLPLYGDYADGFWDRTLDDMPGDYPKAFEFRRGQAATIATETFSKDDVSTVSSADSSPQSSLSYPYFTCELGGGMHTSYHRRINMTGEEILSLAICKVGSGSNMPGYYMYHGGTNPSSPLHSMGEMQNSKATNYNDVPYLSYDFQCPLGEVGQVNTLAFHRTRLFHMLLSTWGDKLSGWDPVFPFEGDGGGRLRWTVRTDGHQGFLFVNNFQRMKNLGDKHGVQFRLTDVDGKETVFPGMDVKDGMSFVLPFNLRLTDGRVINYATAQPVTVDDGRILFLALDGIDPVVCIDGVEYRPKLNKTVPTGNGNGSVEVMSYAKAIRQYVVDRPARRLIELRKPHDVVYSLDDKIYSEYWQVNKELKPLPVRPTDGLRTIQMGRQKVAEMPVEADFSKAAVWTLPAATRYSNPQDLFLRISYKGDVARVYADGRLVEDNFWNGKPFYVRVSDIVGRKVEIKILPLGKDYPIYLQKEQRQQLLDAKGDYLLSLDKVELVERKTLCL